MDYVKNVYAICTLCVLLSLSGCGITSILINKEYRADTFASRFGFKKESFKTTNFTLMTYQRCTGRSETLCIYIEGDGSAWVTKSRLSRDPTPSNPMALQLAVVDLSDNVVYIARPGQFFGPNAGGCDSAYWSGRRFSPEVVDAVSRVIDIVKGRLGATQVQLVGYSGGGALAVLLAAQRSDIVALRTVAGNLDPQSWCAYHQVSQLDGSMNPLNVAPQVAGVAQRHFVGSNDRIMPIFIARSFVKKMGDKDDRRIIVVKGASHHSGWYAQWSKLLGEPISDKPLLNAIR